MPENPQIPNIHYIEMALNAACTTHKGSLSRSSERRGNEAKTNLRKLAINAVNAIERALDPKPNEKVHFFFSPHCGPKNLKELPRAFYFVKPKSHEKYDRNKIKMAVWIAVNDKIIAEMKLSIYLSVGDWIKIGDNLPITIEELASAVKDYLRYDKKINSFLEIERNIHEEISPLISKS